MPHEPSGSCPPVQQAPATRCPARESDLSATECATLAGLSRISARRYLEFFAETGRVKVRLKYGAGRPERRYRWGAS